MNKYCGINEPKLEVINKFLSTNGITNIKIKGLMTPELKTLNVMNRTFNHKSCFEEEKS